MTKPTFLGILVFYFNDLHMLNKNNKTIIYSITVDVSAIVGALTILVLRDHHCFNGLMLVTAWDKDEAQGCSRQRVDGC
jgi:hypothetical protein